MSPFSSIPTEVLALILDHVNRSDLYECTLVNRAFQQHTAPVLWHHLVIDTDERLNTIVFSIGIHVRSLTLSYRVEDAQLMGLLAHVPFLEHLRLHRATAVTDLSYSQIPRCCPHLVSVYTYYGHITKAASQALGQCPLLASVSFESCSYLNADVLAPLGLCPLQHIHLSTSHTFNLADGFAENTAWAASTFQGLTSLELHDFRNDYTGFVKTTVAQGFRWPQLTHLMLVGCWRMDDTHIIALVHAHPRILSLSLDKCNLTDKVLDVIPHALPQIRQIDLRRNPRLSLQALTKLVQQCHSLQDPVDCAFCDFLISDEQYKTMDQDIYYASSDFDGYEIVAIFPLTL